jgi:hypothetical protein
MPFTLFVSVTLLRETHLTLVARKLMDDVWTAGRLTELIAFIQYERGRWSCPSGQCLSQTG